MIFTDQLGRPVNIPHPPRRIISLVPSQTELLYDLGLEEEVIGITKFCIHPAHWFRNKQRIGGTKDFKTDLILSLKPDLVLGNKEENTENGLVALMPHVPVWISDISTLSQALEMISSIGKICNKEARAEQLCHDIETGFDRLPVNNIRKRAAYFIWKDPWMLAGTDTFISDMLNRCGLQNYTAKTRYPEVSLSDLKNDPPDLILLSSEPYPFKEEDVTALQALTGIREIILADGEYFSWYGSRLKNAPSYFKTLHLIGHKGQGR
jgi:ABC-type Fe3+-hydroxamate transport system substrate-binding protein